MALTVIAVGVAVLLAAAYWIKTRRNHREMERYSITPENLHGMLATSREVLVFDVRQPLDLLAESEIIPGAKRLSPKEVIENPSLIPKEQEVIVYCTCVSEKTSRAILHRALSQQYFQVKFLRGGLAGWKAKGYPVEPYDKPFHLDPSV